MNELMNHVKSDLRSFVKEEDGWGMVEWGILGAAIAVLAVAVTQLIMPKIKDLFTKTGENLDTAKDVKW